MTREVRMELINKIEEKLKTRLIVYIAGDRRGMETKIATDIFPLFHQHLINIDNTERIHLLLYSTGGDTIAGYGLVHLIREFCNEFNIIIPFKAYSCATLISLGANQVIMTRMGQLSPIDPSVGHPLGPLVQIPNQPGGARIAPVNVEDVNAFIDLAKKEFGLNEEESMREVFKHLSDKVNPLVLGAIHRSREQIAFLAQTLMSYHMEDENKIKSTVTTLSRERFSHNYLIGRKEAKEILGLNVIDPEPMLSKDIIALFDEYKNMINLDTPYHPDVFLGAEDTKIGTFHRAIIESTDLTHSFQTKKEVKRVEVQQPGIPIPIIGHQERILEEVWVLNNEI